MKGCPVKLPACHGGLLQMGHPKICRLFDPIGSRSINECVGRLRFGRPEASSGLRRNAFFCGMLKNFSRFTRYRLRLESKHHLRKSKCFHVQSTSSIATPRRATPKSCRRCYLAPIQLNRHLPSHDLKEHANPPFVVKMHKSTKRFSKRSRQDADLLADLKVAIQTNQSRSLR